MSHRLFRRAAVGTAVVIGAVVLPSAIASAHVTVSAPGAVQGGSDQEITFRVPVEKDVDTIGLTVAFPTSTPIADVLVEPVPGWTHAQTSVHLSTPIVTDDGSITDAVSQITWTAQHGHGLKPGEFGAFTVIAGQLPGADSLTFKAIQRYADGSAVAWTQTEAPGSTADLEHPAPVLTLGAAVSSQPRGETASGAAASPTSRSSSHPGRATWALAVSIVAVALGAAGLGVAITARSGRRVQKREQPAAS